jgi:histidinol-phosphate aminotransferase
MVNPYMVGELTREVAAEALKHHEHITKSKKAFADMKKQLRKELGCTRHNPEGASGRLHMAETLDTNSLLLLYHDDKNINLKDEFFKRGVLVIDGYDFKGLDSSAARVRLPKKREFPKLLEAVREINAL